ncbi:MAG: hypothetical protein ACE15C_12850 [Phycisphaerae bacterium]
MNRRRLILMAAGGVVAAIVVAACGYWLSGASAPSKYADAHRAPKIRPDYTNITIPPNIAPMNFLVDEPGSRYFVRIYGPNGRGIDISASGHDIDIPMGQWRTLLAANRGGHISIDVYAQGEDGRWLRFDTVTNTVAPEDIDNHLVYRLVFPGVHNWADLGLYQRDLENFEESKILHSLSIETSCCNCHSFHRNDPNTMLFHVRQGPIFPGSGMLVWRDGEVAKIDTRTSVNPSPVAYSSWHPSGRLVAFSVNKIKLFTHSIGWDLRDQLDYTSDLCVYDLEARKLVFPPKISLPDKLETFPCWSPDGKYLYFSRADMRWNKDIDYVPADQYKSVLYSLMRISYDAATNTWGEVEMVLPAEKVPKVSASPDAPPDQGFGRSVLEPKVSPDGRFILLAVVDYGNVPIFQRNSDLYMYDLATGRHWYPSCNSDECDSWHCWSSNGRWIVFSSRRGNGQFARPHFSYIDADGKDSKAFILPQKEPDFYDTFLKTYNIPELVTGPVTVKEDELIQALEKEDPSQKAIPVTGATHKASTSAPADQ